MNAIEKCESCSNLDLSYNGLGDNEAEHLGKALKKNYSGNDKPYGPGGNRDPCLMVERPLHVLRA